MLSLGLDFSVKMTDIAVKAAFSLLRYTPNSLRLESQLPMQGWICSASASECWDHWCAPHLALTGSCVMMQDRRLQGQGWGFSVASLTNTSTEFQTVT